MCASVLTNSGSMSKWLKPFLFGIWGLLLIPLIAAILEKWLQEKFFSDPNAVATTVSHNIVAVGQLRWFKFALVFWTGIVIGVSLEWLTRKSDEKKASAFLCEYFRCVGKLLEDGHFDEANREALSWKPFLDKAKPP